MNRLIHYFFKLLELLVVILMVAMVIMVFGNVFLRYAFNSGITISDEMSRYCFIWLTYIGAMVAMREGGHLGLTPWSSTCPGAEKNSACSSARA